MVHERIIAAVAGHRILTTCVLNMCSFPFGFVRGILGAHVVVVIVVVLGPLLVVGVCG